jgi:hypothetical protein
VSDPRVLGVEGPKVTVVKVVCRPVPRREIEDEGDCPWLGARALELEQMYAVTTPPGR